MIAVYGSYAHSDNEVEVVTDMATERGQTGFITTIRKTLTITIEMVNSDPYTLRTRVEQLKQAYVDGYDFQLLMPDGSPSGVELISGKSRSGTRVNRFAEPRGGADEWATKRTVLIVLEAEYGPDFFGQTGNQQVEFHESVSFIGGGPSFIHVVVPVGPPVKQMVAEQTPYRAVQRGSAKGLGSYPDFSRVLFPAHEKRDRRVQTKLTPEPAGNGYGAYPIEWQYEYESAAVLTADPNTFK